MARTPAAESSCNSTSNSTNVPQAHLQLRLSFPHTARQLPTATTSPCSQAAPSSLHSRRLPVRLLLELSHAARCHSHSLLRCCHLLLQLLPPLAQLLQLLEPRRIV